MKSRRITLPSDLAARAGCAEAEIRVDENGLVDLYRLDGERLRCFSPKEMEHLIDGPDTVAMIDRADDRNETERRGRVLSAKNYGGTPRKTGYLRGLMNKHARRSA